MQLTVQSQLVGSAALVRCRGRLTLGEEAAALQQEVERLRIETSNIVLQVSEVTFIDSAGVGTLVRLLGVLRANHGGLKLCGLSSQMHHVLEATNLLGVFEPYATEKEALDAFAGRPKPAVGTPASTGERIVCFDSSCDLLAYLNALLKRSGFEVQTSRYLADAMTLVRVTQPKVVICGPGVPSAMEKFRQIDAKLHVVPLPNDFSASEASQAGLELVQQIRLILNP